MSDDQSHDVSLTKASLIRVCLGHGMTPAARVADMVEHFGRREVLAVARKTYGSAAREAIRMIELSDALAREEEFERLHGRPSLEERMKAEQERTRPDCSSSWRPLAAMEAE